MSNAWALAMVSMAIVVAIVIPLAGLFAFRPHRARAVRAAEGQSELLARRIAYLRISHPEIVKIDRLDRHPVYLSWCLSILAFGIVVMFVEIPYSTHGAEALGTRATLGVSLILGSVLMLSGSLMGAHLRGRCFIKGVCSNAVSSTLGDDIRLPYVLGWWGMVSMAVSMGFYQYTVWASVGYYRVLTTYGGLESIINIPTALVMIPLFISRLRRYITEREILIAEAMEIMAAEDSDDGH